MAILATRLGCRIAIDSTPWDGAALLDTAVNSRVPSNAKKDGRTQAREAGRIPGSAGLRRDLMEDFAPRRTSVSRTSQLGDSEDDPQRGGLRLRLRGGIPRSVVGRVLAAVALLAALGATIAGMWELRSLLLKNPRLVVSSSSAIQITGNSHLSRAQLLTVFGGDVDRNILTVPLAERRAELERLPWVEHATVMRLLPNHFRVAIAERKPVAFVRQGSTIGLVDANGVLLDMAPDEDAPEQPHYSFPVVTGISAQDPLSVRAARMKLYARFTADLGDQTKKVSEVDLSNPEDVKALIPDAGSDILVHFGDDKFLHRFEVYEKNLPGWRKDFPKMASADMRYQNQVVIEMQPGAVVPDNAAAGADAASPAPAATAAPAKGGKKSASPPQSKKPIEMGHPAAVQHLTNSFDVHPKASAVPQ
jgi:cell division protein FtsQ